MEKVLGSYRRNWSFTKMADHKKKRTEKHIAKSKAAAQKENVQSNMAAIKETGSQIVKLFVKLSVRYHRRITLPNSIRNLWVLFSIRHQDSGKPAAATHWIANRKIGQWQKVTWTVEICLADTALFAFLRGWKNAQFASDTSKMQPALLIHPSIHLSIHSSMQFPCSQINTALTKKNVTIATWCTRSTCWLSYFPISKPCFFFYNFFSFFVTFFVEFQNGFLIIEKICALAILPSFMIIQGVVSHDLCCRYLCIETMVFQFHFMKNLLLSMHSFAVPIPMTFSFVIHESLEIYKYKIYIIMFYAFFGFIWTMNHILWSNWIG